MSRHLDDTGTGHPILGFLDLLEAGLDEVAGARAWSLTATETTAAVTRLVGYLARLAELETRLIEQAETLGLPDELGVRGVDRWLARTTRMTLGEARRRTKLTTAFAQHPSTAAAVSVGRVLPEQALVIDAAVDQLDDAYADRRAEAEEHLLTQAGQFDAHQLRVLGEHLVEVIDPEGAEAHEAKKLAEQDERARAKTELRMRRGGDGTVSGSFVLPESTAEILRKALQALAAPKHVRSVEGAGAFDHEKPSPQRMGWAFTEYVERYPADRLAKQGGMAATIVVTVEAEAFTQGAPKPARTDTGVAVSPGTLLRWACEAKLIPAVLDKGGRVLDLGRSHRFHTEHQRLALILEQKTCQHPACDVPGSYCHVHHTHPWAQGGQTNTRDAALLCPFHHHQAHAGLVDYPMRT